MALDGKAIKEEIPDKEVYDSGSVRRAKGESTSDILITQLEDIFSHLNEACVCLLYVIEVLSLPLINQLVTGKKVLTDCRHNQFIGALKFIVKNFIRQGTLFSAAAASILRLMAINHVLMSQLNTSGDSLIII